MSAGWAASIYFLMQEKIERERGPVRCGVALSYSPYVGGCTGRARARVRVCSLW